MITNLFKEAAVKFRLTPDSKSWMITGSSHTVCHEKIKAKYAANTMKFPDVFQVEEGYILNNGMFVNRLDAMKVAKSANIIKESYIDDLMFFDYKVDWSKVHEN